MAAKMKQENDKVLGKRDKVSEMSDTAVYSGAMRDAFPVRRHGSAKAAIFAAYRFLSPLVRKQFTPRRARSIWEGTARRIDAEEAAALRLAEIEEAKREQQELRARLASLDRALAVADAEFHRETIAAIQSQVRGLGGVDRTRVEGE
jgi:hypothetical protein